MHYPLPLVNLTQFSNTYLLSDLVIMTSHHLVSHLGASRHCLFWDWAVLTYTTDSANKAQPYSLSEIYPSDNLPHLFHASRFHSMLTKPCLIHLPAIPSFPSYCLEESIPFIIKERNLCSYPIWRYESWLFEKWNIASATPWFQSVSFCSSGSHCFLCPLHLKTHGMSSRSHGPHIACTPISKTREDNCTKANIIYTIVPLFLVRSS